ncbi:MAG TPA: hypothetical protein VJP88_11570 [Caulobacteraceae bacterium]|nr:hypothetical protein [Caulobacteraceae bacterium]
MALKHILIAVPTMAGLMKTKTATTLVILMRQLTRAGILADYLNIDSSDIVYARNYFARVVLESETLDALLFVDSDMQFPPSLVMKMLNLGADVVGAAYTKRVLDMDRFSQAVNTAKTYSPEAKARALANTYNFTVVPSWTSPTVERMDVLNGFAKMAAVGMGCSLITKAALQAMIEGKVVEPRKDIIDGVPQVGWAFFDCMKVQDITLSEDFSFCYRWTRMLGRDLWVNIDEVVTHLGDFPHEARYIDRLAKVGVKPNPLAANAPDSTAIHVDADLIVGAES